MQINDIELHAQGASTFTDDIPLPQGTLHAFPVVSTIAHGKILAIDTRCRTGLSRRRADFIGPGYSRD